VVEGLLMVKWIFIIVAIGLVLDPSTSESKEPGSHLGLSVGIPQGVSLAYETGPTSWMRFQGTICPGLIINIGTIRAALVSAHKAHPYLFVGVGSLLFPLGINDPNAEVSRGFYWTGIGVRRDHSRGMLFMELGVTGWIDEPEGNTVSAGVGFLFD